MVGKGDLTKSRILDHAIDVASVEGLEGLTIGRLSNDLELSKSGLFAHFGSKERLQLCVLGEASRQFVDAVLRPALKKKAGIPRIRAIFANWLSYSKDNAPNGGCLLLAAGAELDDRPGPVRDFLVDSRKALMRTLAKSARISIDVGDFREDLDTSQFAFDMFSAMLGYHHASRLLKDKRANKHLRTAFEQILEAASA